MEIIQYGGLRKRVLIERLQSLQWRRSVQAEVIREGDQRTFRLHSEAAASQDPKSSEANSARG